MPYKQRMFTAPLKSTCRYHYCFLSATARSGGTAEWRAHCVWMFQQTDGLYSYWGQKICHCFLVCCCHSDRLTVTSSPIKDAGHSVLVKEPVKIKDPLLHLSCRWNLSGHIFPKKLCCSSPISFKRRIKSHLPFAGIIRSSPYSPHFRIMVKFRLFSKSQKNIMQYK